MTSQAHGRRHHRGKPIPDFQKKRIKFICKHPNGGALVLTVVGGDQFIKPVALWYQSNGQWLLNAVVDQQDMPEWAENYTKGTATRKSGI